MRVLLPGEGARDYSALLRGAETLKGRELESRAATAEAEARFFFNVVLTLGGLFPGFSLVYSVHPALESLHPVILPHFGQTIDSH